MSLEGLLKELDRTRRDEQEKMISLMKEQFEAMIKAKDQEIASLRDEITTLRNWLDHSALPAANPVSKRSDSMGLIKMNFGSDKPCPEVYSPGEKEMLESVARKEPWAGISGAGPSDIQNPARQELSGMPHVPLPNRDAVGKETNKSSVGHLLETGYSSEPTDDAGFPETGPTPSSADVQDGLDAELRLPRPDIPGFDEKPAVKKAARPRKKAASAKKPVRKR